MLCSAAILVNATLIVTPLIAMINLNSSALFTGQDDLSASPLNGFVHDQIGHFRAGILNLTTKNYLKL